MMSKKISFVLYPLQNFTYDHHSVVLVFVSQQFADQLGTRFPYLHNTGNEVVDIGFLNR